MADKKSFVMYMSWSPLFENLPKEQAGELIQAIYAYQKNPEYMPEDPTLAAMFSMCRDTMEADQEKYEARCAKNAQIAKEREELKRTRTCTNVNEEERLATDNESDSDNDSESDSDNDLKTSCSEPISEPEYPCEALVLNDGSAWRPTISQYEEYERLYPGVDVNRQFAEMRAWCLSNPQKRKTRRGITRFVNSWLSKEQDRGVQAKSVQPRSRPPDKFQYEDQRKYDYDAIEQAMLERTRNEL